MQKINCIAVVGSRSLHIDVEKFVPPGVMRIITGGAHGIDISAIDFAKKNDIPLTIIRPDYDKFGTLAPLIRNKKIVNLCDSLIAIWDGKSPGTRNVISISIKSKKLTKIFIVKKNSIIKRVYNASEQIRLF